MLSSTLGLDSGRGTSLRLFASGGISGQLGRFTRPFLDYTAAALRVDVGLTSPHVVGLLPDPSSLVASDTHRWGTMAAAGWHVVEDSVLYCVCVVAFGEGRGGGDWPLFSPSLPPALGGRLLHPWPVGGTSR